VAVLLHRLGPTLAASDHAAEDSLRRDGRAIRVAPARLRARRVRGSPFVVTSRFLERSPLTSDGDEGRRGLRVSPPSCRAAFAAWQRDSGCRGRPHPTVKAEPTRALYQVIRAGRATNVPFTAILSGQPRTTPRRPRPAAIPVSPGSDLPNWLCKQGVAWSRSGPWRRRTRGHHGVVALVRARSAPQQEPLVLGGHERSPSGYENPRSHGMQDRDLGQRSRLGSNPSAPLAGSCDLIWGRHDSAGVLPN